MIRRKMSRSELRAEIDSLEKRLEEGRGALVDALYGETAAKLTLAADRARIAAAIREEFAAHRYWYAGDEALERLLRVVEGG